MSKALYLRSCKNAANKKIDDDMGVKPIRKEIITDHVSGLILGLRLANERRRYFVTAQA